MPGCLGVCSPALLNLEGQSCGSFYLESLAEPALFGGSVLIQEFLQDYGCALRILLVFLVPILESDIPGP